jgi:hypothetical protein
VVTLANRFDYMMLVAWAAPTQPLVSIGSISIRVAAWVGDYRNVIIDYRDVPAWT